MWRGVPPTTIGEGFLELWGGISTNEFGEGFLILLQLMSLERDSCTTTTDNEFGEGFLELWGGISTNEFGEGFLILLRLMSLEKIKTLLVLTYLVHISPILGALLIV